jgi:HEAT repeat protein
MRRALLTVLVCNASVATAGGADVARMFLWQRLTPRLQQGYTIEMRAPPEPPSGNLELDYVTGGDVPQYVRYVFVVEDACTLAIRTNVRDCALNAGRAGCDVDVAALQRQTYQDLLDGLAAICTLRFKNVADVEGAEDRRHPPAISGEMDIGGALNRHMPLPVCNLAQLVDCGHDEELVARALYEFVQNQQGQWKWRSANEEERAMAGRLLLRSLPDSKGYRRVLRARALGFLGYTPAVDALRDLAAAVPEAKLALFQIDIASRCREDVVLPELVRAIASDDSWLSTWALDVGKRRCGSAYSSLLRDGFAIASPGARMRLFKEAKAVGAMDVIRDARMDPSAVLRVEAAAVLGDESELLRVASNKGLRLREEFQARRAAIVYLSRDHEGPVDASVPKGLCKLLRDEGEDVRVRADAARALGRLDVKGATSTLVDMINGKAPERPVYLTADDFSLEEYCQLDDVRLGAAEALGYLRDQAAVGALVGLLRRSEQKYEWHLREAAGVALAWIGSPSTSEVLREARKREDGSEWAEAWARTVRLYDAVRAGDGRGILVEVDGDPRAVERLLAARCSAAELVRLSSSNELAEWQRRIVRQALRGK